MISKNIARKYKIDLLSIAYQWKWTSIQVFFHQISSEQVVCLEDFSIFNISIKIIYFQIMLCKIVLKNSQNIIHNCYHGNQNQNVFYCININKFNKGKTEIW